MTKKDYVEFAKVIARFQSQLHPQLQDDIAVGLVVPLAHMFKRDNPNFDYARFLRACGIKAEKVE